MKKYFIVFVAIMFTFMLQLSVISAADDNANLNQKYNNMNVNAVSCGKDSTSGEFYLTKIPNTVPEIIHIVYLGLQIAVPIIIIIFGTIDLIKAVIASKEDDIKKAQMTFVKRLIAGALVFFVFVIVKFLVSFTADNSSSRIMSCVDCFLSGPSACESE